MYSDDLNTPENLSKIRDSIIDYLKSYSKKEVIENYKQILKKSEIDCYALKVKEVYIMHLRD
jgi:hypothetical protein